MKVHAIPDTATLTKEITDGGKVGIGVHAGRKAEGDQIQRMETQASTKIPDNPVTTDFGFNLQFAVDKETGEQVVKVLDPETGKVLRQYPPEEFLQVVKNLRDLKGVLFSTRL